MSKGTDHDLIAGYALNALDQLDRERFEAHLAGCTICALELGSLMGAAVSLAYALDDQPPPAALRRQLLTRVRKDKAICSEATRGRRPRRTLTAVLATASVLCVVGGGSAWAIAFWSSGAERRNRLAEATIAAVVANPDARTLRLGGYPGRLVLAPDGRAVLVAGRFPRSQRGHKYEIWVTGSLDQPRPAGSFTGGQRSLVLLTRRVPKGAEVTVTREAGRVPVPTGPVVAQIDGTA